MSDEAIPKGELLARLKKNLQATGDEVPAPPDSGRFADDLIPDPGDAARSPEDVELEQALKSFPIEAAYDRWVDKVTTKKKLANGEVGVRCPNPDHEDKNPSAWFKPATNVGYCVACDLGWDIYDLYAWWHNYPVPGYKDRTMFPDMRRDMALDLGFSFSTRSGKDYLVDETAESVDDDPQPADNAVDDGDSTVRSLSLVPEADDDDGPEPFIGGEIDHEAILAIAGESPTFLSEWMRATSRDDQPEEFYFMLGLLALGCAVGNDICMEDSQAVRSNLLVCLMGITGSGKSRSVRNMQRMLTEAVPYDRETGSGVKMIRDPSSGEVLLPMFQHADDAGKVDPSVPVRGLVTIEELWALSAQGNRSGAKLKPVLMDLYDGPDTGSSSVRGGIVEPKNTYMALVTTTQNKLIAELVSAGDANSGFSNRFLYVSGRYKKLKSWGGTRLDFTTPSQMLREIRGWASPARDLTFTNDGLERWDEFFEHVLVPLKRDEDRPTFARADLLFKKLMLLFAINNKSDLIDLVAVEQALSLWPYVKESYGFVDYETTVRKEVRDSEALDDRILRVMHNMTDRQVAKKEERKLPTEREIQRALGMWNKGNKHSKDEFGKRFRILEEMGYFERIRNGHATLIRLIK